jgi:hypothetical protein
MMALSHAKEGGCVGSARDAVAWLCTSLLTEDTLEVFNCCRPNPVGVLERQDLPFSGYGRGEAPPDHLQLQQLRVKLACTGHSRNLNLRGIQLGSNTVC